jgi:SAM-dependent methyltransferase
VLIALYGRALRLLQAVALVALVAMLFHESRAPGDSWSPYYKVSLYPSVRGAWGINVNGIPHQFMLSTAMRKTTEPVYFLPYQRARGNPLRDVLIVGAGNGGDVAIALAAGAKHVDAVEIDPRIYQIGRDMNPDHPYQDPRVSVHIDDGRAYLQRSRKHYDLILFALPDSLVLVAGQSSLRLESYLFTLEAMQAARAHLNPGGAFGMYNYYRETWLIDRLGGTLQAAYGHAPCVDSVGRYGRFALLMASATPGALHCGATWVAATSPAPAPADDDHPFLYLRTRSIPALYLASIAGILLVSLLLIRGAAGSLRQMGRYADLFFMGTAFMLLETKNVVQFALLFGTTWFVNALVFFGILLSVYAAVELARRVRIRNLAVLYGALFAALALAWMIPPESLLGLELPLRFAAAVSLAFAPIFLANLVFAERFRDVGLSTVAFGANLLGAMVGGILEYSSLVIGYRSLLFVIAALYGFAFLFRQKEAALVGKVETEAGEGAPEYAPV